MSGTADGTVLSNTASVSSSTPDPNTANNQSTASTTVVFPRADLSVTKTGPATAEPNTNITYTITYANHGPATATDVSMTDTLPSGETFVDANFIGSPPVTSCGLGSTISCNTSTLSSGSSVGLTVTTRVASGTADGTVLSNTASVSSGAQEIDPNSANNTSTASTTVRLPRADVGVTKTGPASAAPNTNITYTITYANHGPDAATNVAMTDTLPAGETFVDANFIGSPPVTSCGLGSTISCNTSTLSSGSSVGLTVTTRIASGTADGTVLSNTASVSESSGEVDPNPANNTSTAATLVLSQGSGGPGGGGGNPGATPELDSLLLFGSGLSGLAGYAALRLRTRRRRR